MKAPRLTQTLPGTSERWLETVAADYSGALNGFFLRRTGSPSDAEDLVQEVFARLAQMEDASRMDNPQAYIFQIAVNLLRDKARRARVRQSEMHEPFDEAFHGEGGGSPERMAVVRDDLRRIEAALQRLPKKTRTIFLLHRLDGLKYREIADAMGLSVSTVEKHMIKALAAITRRMKGRTV